MAKRKSLTKKIRFEVFKRDKFTCQYCGRMSPDVILEVDHIKPIADGGDNELINLITSCRDCNRGKGKTRLTDDTELKKQQNQLKELAERKEQIELMSKYRSDLLKFKEFQINDLCACWSQLTDNEYMLNENGRIRLNKLISEFDVEEIYDAMEIAINRYYKGDEDSLENAFSKIGGICYNRRKQNGNI
jgi:hypothetical protein